MNDADTTTKTAEFDWRKFDAMTDQEVHAAAMTDPDARPMTDAEWDAAPKVPRVRIIRRALGLTQEAFATRFQIPLGTLRDWKQARRMQRWAHRTARQPRRCCAWVWRAAAGYPRGA